MAKETKKLWSGRFSTETNRLVDEMNASITFDIRLAAHDIRGSIAHAETLKKAGLLNAAELKKITVGLKKVGREIESGKYQPGIETEDIHMAIEARLTELIGPLGGKLHTARSRNDQVALTTRLFLKDETTEIIELTRALRRAIVEVAEEHTDTIMPGYTHLQRAQPILLAHHLLAYYEMLSRDEERFNDTLRRTDSMPLGSGALAGTPYRLDRRFTAKLLGFSKITENSLDSVSDRDFAIEFISAASILMMHLSRLSEELIIWASSEFGFVEFSDAFATGSSIMPQKKNPDIPELVRGKTARVYGNLTTLLSVMKSLPLAYNKDMQEDKEPLFDTIDTIKASLSVYTPMLKSMKFNKERMHAGTVEGFLTATDAADYLAEKGLPFRECHHIVGRVVGYCINAGKGLEELTLKEWQGFSKLFEKDIKKRITAEASTKSRRTHGGTSPAEVKKRLRQIAKGLK